MRVHRTRMASGRRPRTRVREFRRWYRRLHGHNALLCGPGARKRRDARIAWHNEHKGES